MKSRFSWLLAAALILGPGVTAQVIDVPLTLHLRPDRTRGFFPLGIAQPEKSLEAPAGEWKLPELKSEVPVFFQHRLGDQELLFILDRKGKDSAFYDLLYFDANGNRDLTDDPVIAGKSLGRGRPGLEKGKYFYFQYLIETIIRVDGRPAPYPFRVNVSYSAMRRVRNASGEGWTMKYLTHSTAEVARFLNVTLMTQGAYRGEFNLGDQVYHVILHDNNADGRFGDRMRKPKPGSRRRARNDLLFLAAKKEFTYQDGVEIGNLLHLDGRLFEIEFCDPERKLTLTPRTEGLARCDLAMETERLILASEDGANLVMAMHPGKGVDLPPGEYHLVSYSASKKDDGGNVWNLKAVAAKDAPVAQVGSGGAAALRFGEPFLATVDANRLAGEKASLRLKVLGAGGETLKSLRCLTDNKSSIERSTKKKYMPKEPAYRIVAKVGSAAVQGSFEYG